MGRHLVQSDCKYLVLNAKKTLQITPREMSFCFFFFFSHSKNYYLNSHDSTQNSNLSSSEMCCS